MSEAPSRQYMPEYRAMSTIELLNEYKALHARRDRGYGTQERIIALWDVIEERDGELDKLRAALRTVRDVLASGEAFDEASLVKIADEALGEK